MVLVAQMVHAADEKPARKGGSRQLIQISPCNDVPAHPFDLILGRPTSNSVTISVLTYQNAEGCIEFGTRRGKLDSATPLARPEAIDSTWRRIRKMNTV